MARAWAAEPEPGDDTVRAVTGRGWDDWCDVIDAWAGHVDGHMAIAAHLQAEEGVDGWWAQSLTVGYERITGLRQRHQQPDGTFAVSASRTVTADAVELRRQLLDPAARARLFPGHTTDLRSRPTAKNVRLGLDPGTAEIAIMAKADGRITVAVQHSRLPDAGDVARWRTFWSGWLDGIERPGGLAD